MNPHDRRRIITQNVHKSLDELAGKPQRTEFDSMLEKLDIAVNVVKVNINAILKAGGYKDREALKGMVFKTLFEQLERLDKDERHVLLTAIVSDRIMDDIDSDRWGSGNPDLLSGK